MTVYYVDPASGVDTNSGNSWVAAWKTLRGLRVNSIVPTTGDEIRFAKSPAFTSSTGSYSMMYGVGMKWSLRGATVLDVGIGGSPSISLLAWSRPNDTVRMTRTVAGMISGGMTITVPAGATPQPNYMTLHAASNAGEYRAPSQTLFGGTMGSMTNTVASNVKKLMCAIRCHIPYTGPGDEHMPAGSLELAIYNNNTLLLTAPLPQIRNSAEIWTPIEIDFTTFTSATISSMVLRINRTAMAIDRDASPFGLEISQIVFSYNTSFRPAGDVLQVERYAMSGTAVTPEIAGTDDMPVLLERVNAGPTPEAFSSNGFMTRRISSSVTAQLRGYTVDAHMAGTHVLSPAPGLGAYDLNGATGGTPESPIKLTGGWDTSTDTQTGYTVFSAGLLSQYGSSIALVDLGFASYVYVDRLAATYGFGSLVTRPGGLHLRKCSFPFSLYPGIAGGNLASNITLEDMTMPPLSMDGIGTIGDLTLRNVFCATGSNPATAKRFEVGDLYMYDSHLAPYSASPWTVHPVPIYVRGNASLEQCSLVRPPTLVSVDFGHTLRFFNRKAHPTNWNVALIPTGPDSRWDLIDYEDDLTNYNFTNTVASTGASCDAKVVMVPGFLFGSPSRFPTSLRGSRVMHSYTDGLNLFLSFIGDPGATYPASGWYESPMASFYGPIGQKYTHMPGGWWGHSFSPSNQWITGSNGNSFTSVQSIGDSAVGLWPGGRQPSTTFPDSAILEPSKVHSGRIALVRKYGNVVYRKTLDSYILTGVNSDYTETIYVRIWETLKAVYLPKAGRYVAHFGCMIENAWYSITQYEPTVFVYAVDYPGGEPGEPYDEWFGRIPAPAPPTSVLMSAQPSYRQYSAVPGEVLGCFAVFAPKLVGPPVVLDYRSATQAEKDAGGGNLNRDEWKDYYLEFEITGPCLVEMRHGSNYGGLTNQTLFDTLELYERE